jgi:hypothetical protein
LQQRRRLALRPHAVAWPLLLTAFQHTHRSFMAVTKSVPLTSSSTFTNDPAPGVHVKYRTSAPSAITLPSFLPRVSTSHSTPANEDPTSKTSLLSTSLVAAEEKSIVLSNTVSSRICTHLHIQHPWSSKSRRGRCSAPWRGSRPCRRPAVRRKSRAQTF